MNGDVLKGPRRPKHIVKKAKEKEIWERKKSVSSLAERVNFRPDSLFSCQKNCHQTNPFDLVQRHLISDWGPKSLCFCACVKAQKLSFSMSAFDSICCSAQPLAFGKVSRPLWMLAGKLGNVQKKCYLTVRLTLSGVSPPHQAWAKALTNIFTGSQPLWSLVSLIVKFKRSFTPSPISTYEIIYIYDIIEWFKIMQQNPQERHYSGAIVPWWTQVLESPQELL